MQGRGAMQAAMPGQGKIGQAKTGKAKAGKAKAGQTQAGQINSGKISGKGKCVKAAPGQKSRVTPGQ
jgi:hypothetical protein